MTLYQKFRKLKINFSQIGLEQSTMPIQYFCTPRGARIIGESGVDGIHYCFIRGFGEMVFAVNPANMPGDYVHPLAQNFEDLLRLLLACGSMDAIEQAHMWDQVQFDAYIKENQPGAEQIAAMDVMRDKLSVTPMEQPFSYIKELQAAFDYSKLKYTPEYYDMIEESPAEPEPPAWKVSFDGGFWPRHGRAGKEIMIDKTFTWGSESWHIPAVYVCSAGLVVDFCVEADPEAISAFIHKWNLFLEYENEYTEEEQSQMHAEHPLNIDFWVKADVNGSVLKQKHGYGTVWIPESCLPEDMQSDREAKWTLEHYGLDLKRGWAIRRVSFPWETKRPGVIKSLLVQLEREPVDVPGIHFKTPGVNDSIIFRHPTSGTEHTFTQREYEAQEIDQQHFCNDSMEYPTYYTAMTYTLSPDISDQGFCVCDCAKGDSPRLKEVNPDGPTSVCVAAVLGMSRSTDDSPRYFHADDSPAQLHVVCSALHFEPVRETEWRMVFKEKLLPDIEVSLIQ